MNPDLLIQICGLPLVAVLAIWAVLLWGFSLFLVFRVKQQLLLTAYLPLTFLPVMAGMFYALANLLSSIDLQMDINNEQPVDSGLLLQMSLIPLLVSVMTCLPATITTVLGRWMLVWKLSGVKIFPDRSTPPQDSGDDGDRWREKEADDYLQKLVRPR